MLVHACGPAHRHLIGMSRNSNYYEVALVGPDCPNAVAPVYLGDYSDQIDCIDKNGMVTVPDGIGYKALLMIGSLSKLIVQPYFV